jgi:hypothetical protein
MSGTAGILGSISQGSRAMLALPMREKSAGARRIITAEQLMAPECSVVLPRLNDAPVEHRFLADDREAMALAETLVKSGIGAVEDWEESKRDPPKYVLLTLQRWIRDHGGAAIDRRFDLDVALSDRLVDHSDEGGPEGTLSLIVDPESAAFVVLSPGIELLEEVHPRLPATFFRHFTGSLNRWVRVFDFCCGQQK